MRSLVWDGDESVNQSWGCTDLQVEPYWAQPGCHWHCGIDIGSWDCKGKTLYAARAGTVTAVGFGYLRITPDPIDGEDWYLHGEYSVGLGARVAQRQQIGVFSDRAPSGGFVTGPHLHFEVQDRGWMNNPASSRDPIPFLTVAYSAGSGDPGGDMATEADIEQALKSTGVVGGITSLYNALVGPADRLASAGKPSQALWEKLDALQKAITTVQPIAGGSDPALVAAVGQLTAAVGQLAGDVQALNKHLGVGTP